MNRVLAGQRIVRRESRRAVRRGLLVGGAAGLALVAAAAVAARALERLSFFRLAAVDVRLSPGARFVTRDSVRALARVPAGASLPAIDLSEVAARVRRHPWAEAVSVRRELPDRLVIEVKERRLAAIVQLDRLYFADTAGRIVKPVERAEAADAPIVTGLGAESVAADPAGVAARLVQGLDLIAAASARLSLPVSELHVDPSLGFVLRTGAATLSAAGPVGVSPGLTLVIGEGPFGPKLDRLAAVLGYLAAEGRAAESVDLTQGHRAVVRLRVPAPPGDLAVAAPKPASYRPSEGQEL